MTKRELEKIAKENRYSPLHIGEEILVRLGYTVENIRHDYNFFEIRVYNSYGDLVCVNIYHPNGELVYINPIVQGNL